MKRILIVLVLLAGVMLGGCAEDPGKATEFLEFEEGDYSVKYPDWAEMEDKNDNEKVKVLRECVVIVSTVDMDADGFFDAIVKNMESAEDAELVSKDKSNLTAEYVMPYEGTPLYSKLKLVYCNRKTYTASFSCPQELKEKEVMDSFLASAECSKSMDEYGQEDIEAQEYSGFKEEDLVMEYPEWQESKAEYHDETLFAVREGSCLVSVDAYDATATGFFEHSKAYLENAPGVVGATYDEGDLEIDFETGESLVKMRMVYCNGKTYRAVVACSEKDFGIKGEVMERALSSLSCLRAYEEPLIEEEKPTTYALFRQEDFSVRMPEWAAAANREVETVKAVNRGSCSFTLSKYNTPKDSMYEWLENEFRTNNTYGLESSDGEELLEYSFGYRDEYVVKAVTKLEYCNYLTYAMTMTCVDEEFELRGEEKDKVFDSMGCAREYVFSDIEIEPAPEEEEDEETEPGEEPPQEEEPGPAGRIVESDVAEEYGLDAEAIVSFLNSNPLFQTLFGGMDKVNFKVEDEVNSRTINLKVDIENGFIVKVRDGLYDNADLGLIMPLDDLMNIINNVENINFGNFLRFAVNIRTEPESMKAELVKKLLEGIF